MHTPARSAEKASQLETHPRYSWVPVYDLFLMIAVFSVLTENTWVPLDCSGTCKKSALQSLCTEWLAKRLGFFFWLPAAQQHNPQGHAIPLNRKGLL